MFPPSHHSLRPSLLRISNKVDPHSRSIIAATWVGLPLRTGDPIRVTVLPDLTAFRGKLLSAKDSGAPVHAASFIRQRRIVLETSLLSSCDILRFIFTHELFHFAWVRLANSHRRAFADLLSDEIQSGARGELGESSGVKKAQVLRRFPQPEESPAWKDYVCESFCDSAAALFSGAGRLPDSTLGKSWTVRRRRWFAGQTQERWKV
jgi:hypothetical protein